MKYIAVRCVQLLTSTIVFLVVHEVMVFCNLAEKKKSFDVLFQK